MGRGGREEKGKKIRLLFLIFGPTISKQCAMMAGVIHILGNNDQEEEEDVLPGRFLRELILFYYCFRKSNKIGT